VQCPVCKEPMIVVEHDRVEVDYCVVCSGLWLDAGEIELLFGDAQAWDRLFQSGGPAVTDEKVRACPACSKNMEKHVVASDSPVTYDRCPRGDGLWFDQGELEALLRHGGKLAGSETITSFLAEVFPDRAQSDNGG